MKTNLKPVYREEEVKPIGEQSIADITGRKDVKEVLKRSVPVFEEDLIDFRNPFVKWLNSLIHYVK